MHINSFLSPIWLLVRRHRILTLWTSVIKHPQDTESLDQRSIHIDLFVTNSFTNKPELGPVWKTTTSLHICLSQPPNKHFDILFIHHTQCRCRLRPLPHYILVLVTQFDPCPRSSQLLFLLTSPPSLLLSSLLSEPPGPRSAVSSLSVKTGAALGRWVYLCLAFLNLVSGRELCVPSQSSF